MATIVAQSVRSGKVLSKMIARRISALSPGEHDRGLIYRGQGPLVVVGEASTPRGDRRPLLRIPLPFEWMHPIIAPSYLFETDGTRKHPGRLVALCSLVKAHAQLAEVSGRLNGHSAKAHDLFLDGVKRLFDDGGRGVKNVAARAAIMYMPAGTLRLYFSAIGQVEDAPLVAEVAACDGKRDERVVLDHIAVMGTDHMH